MEPRRQQLHDVPDRRYPGRRLRPDRLANIGIGHGAIDGGGGYTYFNPETGPEASAVLGFTYNFENPDTDYQNGVDMHIDWGASQFLNEQFFVGAVGYYYQQLTGDSGAARPWATSSRASLALARRSVTSSRSATRCRAQST